MEILNVLLFQLDKQIINLRKTVTGELKPYIFLQHSQTVSFDSYLLFIIMVFFCTYKYTNASMGYAITQNEC